MIDTKLAKDIESNAAQDAIAAERDAGRVYTTSAQAEAHAETGESLVFFDICTGCGGYIDVIRHIDRMNRYEMRGFYGMPNTDNYRELPVIAIDAASMDAAFIKARQIDEHYASAQRIG